MRWMREPSESDAASLAAYLESFTWEGRDAEAARALVASGLPLWRHLLSLIPMAAGDQRALELGSPPFHTTLLLQRLRRYRVIPSAAPLDARSELVHETSSDDFAERHCF